MIEVDAWQVEYGRELVRKGGLRIQLESRGIRRYWQDQSHTLPLPGGDDHRQQEAATNRYCRHSKRTTVSNDVDLVSSLSIAP